MRTNFVQTCKTSANRINLNRITMRVALIGLFISLGIGNAWAHGGKHTGKVTFYNATGNGTVYLSTASGSNSGQSSSSSPGTQNGKSVVTWTCSETDDSDKKTLYPRGEANVGYYYAGWTEANNSTSGYKASSTAYNANAQSDIDKNLYGYFKPVTVTGATPANVTINVEDASAVYPTDASERTLSFTTVGSNALTDFTYSPANGTTGKFTFSEWTRVSATQTTVKYQFQGSAGDWGGVNRTIEQNVTLTSKGTGGGAATCKITVKYPNVRITDVTADEIINVTFDPAAATQPGVNKTVVFDVDYCDGTNNFDTPTFSGAGASHFGNVTTSYADGKLTVNYTYSGNKEEATHVATLTLKVKDAIGGTDATYGTKSVTITAQNAPIATDDAKVIAADGVTKLYQGTWAGALTEANKAANAGCTLWLLRDVTGLTASQEVKNTMTLDLNSFTLSGTLTSAGGLLKLNTADKILTIKDAVSGGAIRVNGNIDGRIAAVEVLKGSLILTKGDLVAENANTGTTLANIYAAGVYLGAGATMGMTGGTVTANRTGASGNYCFGIYCAGTGSSASSVNLTGGTVTATFPNGSYAEGVFAAGNSIISNMTVTASSKTTSYALRVEDGHLVVNGGTYTATTTNQEARGLYSLTAPSNKNAVLVNNATFNVTAGTKDARGIWCRSTTTTVSGDPTDANVVLSGVTVNAKTDETTGTTDAYAIMSDAGVCLGIQSGTYTATTKTQNTYALHTSGYTAVVDGTFNANSTTRTAFAIYVNGGITAVKAGTFTASAATAEVHATKILANAKLLTYGGTFRGICTNVASDGWATGSQVMSTGTLEAQGGTFIGEINKAGLTAAQTGCACGIYANTGSNVTLSNATLQAKANNKWLNGGATTTYYGTHGLLTKTTNKLTLTNCTISATSAYQYAFGIRALDTPVEIKNCTVSVDTDYPYNYGIYTYGAANVETSNSTFTCVSQQTYAYGSYVANGMLTATDCKFTVKTLQNNVTSAANNYLRGIYVAAGKKATLNGCTIDAQGNSSVGKEGYGIYVDGSADVDNCTVTVSNINTGAYAIYNSANTSMIGIASGKFKATATTTGVSTNGTAAAAKQQLYGGYYNTNNNLEKYLPEGYSIETLASSSAEYGEGYRYAIRPGSNLDPVCKIGSTPYYTLEEALEFVNKNSGTAYTIYMVKDYTLPAGNYTLPAKATLLVPYKTGSGAGATTAIGAGGSSYVTTNTTPSRFRKLTFANGVSISVLGTIEVSGQKYLTSSNATGIPTGPYGQLVLEENAHIDLESQSNLIAWGYVTGNGSINAKKNATIYETFQLLDMKGGGVTSQLVNDSRNPQIFPITHYAYQNVEAEITYRPGSRAVGWTGASIQSSNQTANDVMMVGNMSSGALFLMADEGEASDTWVKKKYDPVTDRVEYTLNNTATLGSINVDLTSINLASSSYILPIASNMTVTMKYGTMTITQNSYFMPGSVLNIEKEATLTIPSDKALYFVDKAQWVKGYAPAQYVCVTPYSPSFNNGAGGLGSSYSARKAMTSNNSTLQPAELFVHGNIEVNGALYTTESGANIHSTNSDAGTILFNSIAANKDFCQLNSTCGEGAGGPGGSPGGSKCGTLAKLGCTTGTCNCYYWNWNTWPCTSAQLRNSDGSFTSSVSGGAGTYVYKNGAWTKVAKEGCFTTETDGSGKHYYANPSDIVEVVRNSDNSYRDVESGFRRFVWDSKCEWWEVETTPTSEGYYKSIKADHNERYNYYEYNSSADYWQVKNVTVTWNVNGTTTNYSVGYGTHPKYLSAAPSKAATASEYYTWLGWTKDDATEGKFYAKEEELPIVTANTTFYAYFETHKYSYAVLFKNYDGSVLQTSSWEAGQVPYYLGETDPVKPATAAKIYTFTGWSPAFMAVTGTGQVYTAQFDAGTDRTYTVQWVNYDGTVLKEEQVTYGTPPSAPATPTRPNDDYYTYTFDTWSPTVTAVSGNQTYTATYNYEKKVTKYTINFKNGSTTLYSQYLPSGETPEYGGSTPTKDDEEYDYTFDGWSDTDGGSKLASLPAVSGAANYFAVFTHVKKKYTIRWKSEDGKQTYETDYNVPYGTTPSFDGAPLTKPSQGATVYTFDGWSATIGGAKIALPSVTGHATYYAHFSDAPVYTVTFDANGHGTAPSSQKVVENQLVIKPADPAVAEWIFGGWYKEAECTNAWNFASDVVTANRTLYAKWTPAVASVTVNSATTYYATIDDAFTAANNATAASTLTLLQDVTVTTKLTYNNSNNKDCILDLNGHTLTSNTSEQSPLHINNTSVTFTITDGTVEKAGKLSLNSSFSTKAIFGAFVDNGTLLLNAGTIEVTSSTANTCGVTANSNGTFTMNGGTIHVKATNSSKEGRGVYSVGSATINDGTVHVEAAGDGYGIKRDGGTVTVNNGKFNISGSTANVTTQTSANANVVIRGGYYTTNSQLYPTAPYHVFGLDNQSPYLYEVAEGYTLTWTTDGDPLTGTYTSGVTKPGTTIVQPATPTKTGYTFSAWSPAVAETMPVEDTEYTATWTPNTNTAYAVKHYQQNLADDEYTLFETDNLTGTTDAATEAIAKSYTGFTAQSFSQSTIAPDGSTTVSIYYNRDKFTITWNNADGSTLETDANVKYGALPAYDGTTPTKTTDAEYAYAFNGWSPAVSAVTADATYTATYTTTPVVASLTVNSSGNKYYYTDFSEAFNIAKNSVPVTITLLRDASCSEALVYNGSNTDCTLDLNGHTLTGTPSAQLILNINKAGSTFTITDGSANHDGKLSFSSESESTSHCVIVNNGTFVLEEGTIEATSSTASIGAVKVAGGTFTMNENGAVHVKYTGNVSAKNSRLVNATGGTTNINGGTIHLESTSDAIGVVYSSGTVTITGGNFKIEAGGTAAVTNQTGANNSLNIRGGYYSANSTGYFQPHVKIPYHIFSNSDETYIYRVAEAYTITFVDGDGNTLLNPATTNNLWKKGETPAYTGSTPTKSTDAQYTYTFTGWSPVITTVTEAATYTAQFSSTPRTYTVTLNTNDGTINAGDVTEYTYGTGATLPTDVTKDGHEFGGWFDNSGLTGDAVTTISTTETGNKEYWAKWTASIVDRELDIVDWTSSSITINVTNLKAESGTNKNNWTIRVNGVDYTKSNCNTTTRTLTVSGLSLTPNENLLIQLKNDADVIESQHNYKIPQIYNAENATLSDTNEESVVYVYGGKLTISGDAALAALYVCPGAEVEVTDGNTLTVGKLVLRTKPWATAAISGNVTATNVYYTRIAPDGSSEYPTGQYYQFGLPYACAISAVRLSDGTTPAYNTTWILKSYNEESRATNGATGENWDVLSSGTIAAGRGYEMFSSYKYYREYYFPVTPTENTSVDVTRHGNDKNNSGWNIVCSPLMNVYKNESNPVDGLKVSWLLPDGSYDQAWPETIWPALPFSYQASATGSLDFSSGDFNQTVSAPRRAAYKEDIQTEWIHLDVKDENGVGDHTSVFVHPDRFESTYQTGIDVAKQSLTASRALIYSSHAYGEMAFAGVADALLEQGVALTVYSPKEQELTISMRKNDWLNRMAYVWLIDQATGAQIDLLESDYSFNAEAGTTAGRFILMGAFFAPQITTDNGNVQSDDEHIKVTKFIYNDKMYIQINGVIYDATGKLVK